MSWRASAVKRVGPRTGANPQTGLRNTAARSKLSGSGRSEESRNRGICMVSTRIIIAGAVALVVVGAVGALGSGGRQHHRTRDDRNDDNQQGWNGAALRPGRPHSRNRHSPPITCAAASRPGGVRAVSATPGRDHRGAKPRHPPLLALLGRVRPNDQRSNWEDRHGQVGWAVVRGHLFTRLREAILAAGRLHL